jgi:hypothetical protein
MEQRVMFFNHTLTHNIRCHGCGRTVGPEVGFRTVLEVREGPVTGLFHNRSCYDGAVERTKSEEEI